MELEQLYTDLGKAIAEQQEMETALAEKKQFVTSIFNVITQKRKEQGSTEIEVKSKDLKVSKDNA